MTQMLCGKNFSFTKLKINDFFLTGSYPFPKTIPIYDPYGMRAQSHMIQHDIPFTSPPAAMPRPGG
jgi:hypothetical protein